VLHPSQDRQLIATLRSPTSHDGRVVQYGMQTDQDSASRAPSGRRGLQTHTVGARMRTNTSVLLVLASLVAEVLFIGAIAYAFVHFV